MADSNPVENGHSDATSRVGGWLVKLAILGALAALFAFLFTNYRSQLSLESLARQEAQLRAYQASHPVLSYGIAFVIYVVVTALSLPGAAAMTLVYGWLFGFWRAAILVSFASTTGATLAFLLARYLIGNSIQQKFGDRLAKFNEALQREGAFYLFTLRLIPAVPFFVINLVMGLTKMRAWTFWWVSQIGMLPGTAVFVYAGANVPTLEEIAQKGTSSILKLEVIIAFVILGVFPLAVKKLMAFVRKTPPSDAP